MNYLDYEEAPRLGDATSDVANATLLVFMVLTVMLIATLMAMLIVFKVNLEDMDSESAEIVLENQQLKQELAQAKAQFNRPSGGTQINSGLQLWESPKHEHFLTDIRAEENWCQIPIRYQCTKRPEEDVEHLVCPPEGEEGHMKSQGVLPNP